MQAAHLKHTADLMSYTVDAINEGGKPVLNEQQRNRAEMLAIIHDAGKTQSPYTMFQNIGTPKTDAEKAESKAFGEYTFATNGNHDYLDKVLLPLNPDAGRTIGDHHQGNRNTEAEWKAKVGQPGIDRWEIHDDHNTSPASISTLSHMLRVDDVTEAITARGPNTLDWALRQEASMAVDISAYKPPAGPDGKPPLGADGKPVDPSDPTFAAALKALKESGGTLHFSEKPMDPNTIDRDALGYMIEHHVFEKYGQQRDAEEKAAGGKGWSKYDAAKLKETEAQVLDVLHWDERKNELVKGADGKTRTVEENLRMSVHDDPVMSDKNPNKGKDGNTHDVVHATASVVHGAGHLLAKFGHFVHAQVTDTPKDTPKVASEQSNGKSLSS
jgi:hypothetical protein